MSARSRTAAGKWTIEEFIIRLGLPPIVTISDGETKLRCCPECREPIFDQDNIFKNFLSGKCDKWGCIRRGMGPDADFSKTSTYKEICQDCWYKIFPDEYYPHPEDGYGYGNCESCGQQGIITARWIKPEERGMMWHDTSTCVENNCPVNKSNRTN